MFSRHRWLRSMRWRPHALMDAYLQNVHQHGFVQAHNILVKNLDLNKAHDIEQEALNLGYVIRKNGRIIINDRKWSP